MVELKTGVERKISAYDKVVGNKLILSTLFINLEEQNEIGLLFQEKGGDLPCFISYAWANSHRNAHSNNRPLNSSALSWEKGDPRFVKDFLVENGVKCWLDIEQTGKKVGQ